MDSKKWINDLREIRNNNDEILSLKNGHWLVNNKFDVLKKYSSFFFDSHLDSIKSIALKTLSEKHPKFDLKPEERFAAAIHGKVSRFSDEIRKGIAETLAFLGAHGDKLTNCTLHKPEYTATLTIRELFKGADWKLWASLNDILPILAEAAPDEFLSSVENALKQEPCPFNELYRQQGDGITGGNYMTGLYWALECLAWSEEYLSRAILILAELATHDTIESNWANRPANSIRTILLPWFPQTKAYVEKRIASFKGIQRNFPDIAWNILLGLLPNQHQTSSGTYKPKYRLNIPDTFGKDIPTAEYKAQVIEYASMAVEMAKGKPEYITKLVENLDNLPQPAFGIFLEYLSSEEVVKLIDEERQTIWETMNIFIKKHRRFSDAKWALPVEMVNKIETTANKIAPTNPEVLYRHLFSNKDFDFLEKDVDWKTQQDKLFAQRVNALTQIYSVNKIDAVLKLAHHVENPSKVGFAFAEIASDIDEKQVLPKLLNETDSVNKQFIGGYISGRFYKNKIDWLNRIDFGKWTLTDKCGFLLNLPFENEIWEKANELLGENVGEYWKNIIVNPFPSQSSLLPAIEQLLKYNRPRFAIECISAHYYTKKEFRTDLAIKALHDGINSEERSGGMDSYHLTEIIKMLQNDPEVNEDDLFNIEWAYLSLLNSHNNAEPKTLEKSLSQNPDFFVDIIQRMYRSKKEDKKDVEIDKLTKRIAENAWKLLHDWKRPPGKMEDGTFSSDALKSWYDAVKVKTIESGHYEIAMSHLGKVLFYTDADQNGLWIQRSAAELLDEADNKSIRDGYQTEVFNSRGAYTVDPSGKPEIELANQWRSRADEVEKMGLVHFATTLRELAKSYDREAERVRDEFGEKKKDA